MAPDDPRSLATLRAVEDELVEDGYVYRFRHDARPLGDAEGAFLLCGFMMAQRQRIAGDRVAAARWFERTRASCAASGALLRGVRRAPAAAPRQPPAGVCPCASARERCGAGDVISGDAALARTRPGRS